MHPVPRNIIKPVCADAHLGEIAPSPQREQKPRWPPSLLFSSSTLQSRPELTLNQLPSNCVTLGPVDQSFIEGCLCSNDSGTSFCISHCFVFFKKKYNRAISLFSISVHYKWKWASCLIQKKKTTFMNWQLTWQLCASVHFTAAVNMLAWSQGQC